MAQYIGVSNDSQREEKLRRWVAAETRTPEKSLPQGYKALCEYMLKNDIVQYIHLPESEGDPFIMDTTFYGPSFDSAVDTL